MKNVLRLFFAIVLVFAAGGCGEYYETADMMTVANQNGETMTLMATPDNLNIAAGGEVTIKVQLSSYEGKAITGSKVYLTSTMGTLADNNLTTDEAGVAITMLGAPDMQGEAVITATWSTLQGMVRVSMWYDGTNGGSSDTPGGFGDDDDATATGGDTGTGTDTGAGA